MNSSQRSSEAGRGSRKESYWKRLPPWIRGALGKITLLVVSVSVALLAAEGLVRVFAPQQVIIRRPDIWVPSDSLGWTHRANLSTTINTGERTVHVYTDSLGHRIGESTVRAEGDRNVLFLGDSFTEAFQVEYRDSYAGILERSLSEQLGQRVNIDNTAVGGWDPPHYLREARASLNRRSYDLVAVFLYISNDVVHHRRDSIPRRTPTEVHSFGWPDRLSYREIIDEWLYPINDFLESRSQAFIAFKRSARQLLRRLDLTAGYFPFVLRERAQESDAWDVTTGICRDIASLTIQEGAEIVFVVLPSRFQVYERRLQDAIEGFDVKPDEVVDLEVPTRRLTQELQERGLPAVNLLGDFRQAAGKGLELYGSVDPHLSPSGHRVVARSLEPAFLRMLRNRADG